MLKTGNILRKPGLLGGMLLGLAMQIQVQLPLSPLNVTINAADPLVLILAALALPIICICLTRTETRQPALAYLLFALAFFLALALALGHAWYQDGRVASWAAYNRFAGWMILQTFTLAGVWLAFKQGLDGWNGFIRSFLVTALLITLFHAVAVKLEFFLYLFSDQSDVRRLANDQLVGLVGNANAQAIFLSFAFGAMLMAGKTITKDRNWLYLLIQATFIAGITMTTSRALWLALFLSILAFLPFHRPRFLDGIAAIIAIIWIFSTALFDQGMDNGAWHALNRSKEVVDLMAGQDQAHLEDVQAPMTYTKAPSFSAAEFRKKQWSEALSLWQSSPFIGIGLGRFLSESSGYLDKQYIIHSSPLWVLTEIGLLGIAIVTAGLFSLMRLACNLLREAEHPCREVALTLCFALMTCIIMMQFHDLMYQRILWLIIGLLIGFRLKQLANRGDSSTNQ